MKKLILTLIIFLIAATGYPCTVGTISGQVTTDGRPIVFKVRDITEARQQLVYVYKTPYNYVGVKSEGGQVAMGLSESGMAGGNSLVYNGFYPPNKTLLDYVLKTFTSLSDARSYLFNTREYSGNFPFIDSDGAAILYELYLTKWRANYTATYPTRKDQGLWGWVVRANEFHYNPDDTDNTSIGGRYKIGSDIVGQLYDADNLNIKSILKTLIRSSVTRYATMSATVTQGVKSYEDPALSTMWTILGNPNYSVAVPVWVVGVPPELNGPMYDAAKSLSSIYVKPYILDFESHIINQVDYLLNDWRRNGVRDQQRVEHQIAKDGYSLLRSLKNTVNYAPDVSFSVSGNQYYLSAPEGVSVKWNFGDYISYQRNPVYNASGLVSVTVTQNGISQTAWKYVDGCGYQIGHLDYCRDCGPCAEGEGDCDNDSECVGDLICGQVVGIDYCEEPDQECYDVITTECKEVVTTICP